MRTETQEIREYLSTDGKNPFRTWLLELRDVKARAKIRVRLNRIRLGNFGDVKSLGKGIFELRIDAGPGYRMYFGKRANSVILLSGGTKKSQSRDIRKAEEYWRDYLRRTS